MGRRRMQNDLPTAVAANACQNASGALLSLRSVTRIYGQQAAAVRALDSVNLDIHEGEFVAITGPSGSGKSTALSIFGILETPTSGEYRIEGVPVQNLAKNVLALLRNSR